MMDFVCAKCGTTVAAVVAGYRCDCGGLWQTTVSKTCLPFSVRDIKTINPGLARYSTFLPVKEEFLINLSLREEITPLITLTADLIVKDESALPHGSFKDRGAFTLIAFAQMIGAERIVQDSSGNAGLSVAFYSAKAGLPCEIYLPAGTSLSKQAQLRKSGAQVHLITGSRDHCADVLKARLDAQSNRAGDASGELNRATEYSYKDQAYPGSGFLSKNRNANQTFSNPNILSECRDTEDIPVLADYSQVTEKHGFNSEPKVIDKLPFYASHVYQPLFYQGVKTIIYEIFEQLQRIPKHIFLPVGNGTLLLGIIQGLRDLATAGLIDTFPRLIAAQSNNCAPLATAWRRNEDYPLPIMPQATVAEGIAIARPQRGREILSIARRYPISFQTVSEESIEKARIKMAEHGLPMEPTAAVAFASYIDFCQRYGKPADTLIPLTGNN